MALINRDPVVLGAGTGGTPTGGNPPDIADLVNYYDNTLTYVKGDLVTLKPFAGSEWPGLYQALQEAKNKLPTDASYWKEILPAGPNILLQAEVLNAALTAVSAPGAGITAADVESVANLPAFTVRAGKRYRVHVSEPRPAAIGNSTPSDFVAKLHLRTVENLNPDQTVTVTLSPFWWYSGVSPNAAIAAIVANTLVASVKVTEY